MGPEGSRCYYAHTREGVPESEWQTAEDHLLSVAEIAGDLGRPMGIDEWSELAGRLHDLGKFTAEFQRRVGADGAASSAMRVDHSTAGAQFARETLGDVGLPISYAIAGHHGGMPNWMDETDANLQARLRKAIPSVMDVPTSILRTPELTAKSFPFAPNARNLGVQLFLFTKMLFSTLVDADFLDTESFMDAERARDRANPWTLDAMADRLDAHLRALRQSTHDAGSANPAVLAAREAVLEACRAAASNESGLFSLTVPTGGGKTLSSLAFAITHARAHGLRRVIYVIPYTSIIEQNARVFRSVFGEIDGRSPVLEHHSNFDSDDDDRWSRLASENWDAPLVVTTNVQFFESLFSNRPGRSRRVHNIARSVVILDEAQMLPPHLLRPTLRVTHELASTYGSTVLFCTATQPAVQKREEFPDGLTNVREIVPDVRGLFEQLRRTRVEHAGTLTRDDLAARADDEPQILFVVSTRRAARELFESIRNTRTDAYHLSALMYAKHRSRILDEIRERLSADQPVCLVSTQLIEAGVDIDFPTVYREIAGVDSIAQAAGRCNREGRSEIGRVVVFSRANGAPPRQFRSAIDATQTVLRTHDDLLGPEAVNAFFREYYWKTETSGGQDRGGILGLLRRPDVARFQLQFREIADAYRIIDSETLPVIIDPGPDHEDSAVVRAHVDELTRSQVGFGALRALQGFTVQVYEPTLKRLYAAGALDEPRPGVYVLNNPRAYDESIGLIEDDAEVRDPRSMFG